MATKINPRFIVLLFMVIVAGCTRFLTVLGHSPMINFTPIGAMALFGGAYFNQKWKAIVFPLLTLFISDIIIEQLFYKGQYGTLLYNGWYITYGVFVLIVLVGNLLIKKVSFKNVLMAAVVASLTHWIVTDFGSWIMGTIDLTTGKPYARDIHGLVNCYVLALPFLRNFFLGTALYSAVLFGAFELAQLKMPALRLVTK